MDPQAPQSLPPDAGALRTLASGLGFPEAPRWHQGRLWFSDFFQQRVGSVSPAGDVRTELVLDDHPSGLGWDPQGRLLVVAMNRRQLLRVAGGRAEVLAELADHTGGPCNDLLVDAQGRAYVGNFGFDLYARATPRSTVLLRVDPGGAVQVAARDLLFPNGMALTPDGARLILAETHAQRLSVFDVAPDGALGPRRSFAELPGCYPDGLCLDAEGLVWVADARGRRVLRVAEGRGIVQTLGSGEQHAYACMLGGEDRRTLYVCTAPGIGAAAAQRAQGCVRWTRVAVAGVGLP
jgi:sugar lactone lactonase YvrE